MKSGLLVFAIISTLTAQNLGKGVNFWSLEKEISEGREAATEFRRGIRVLSSHAALARLEATLRDLQTRFASQHEYSVTVFDDSAVVLPVLFAFPSTALQRAASEPTVTPDGSIFVPASLLARLQTESELVKMMAHAVAHVADRHVTRLATRRQLVEKAVLRMPPEMRKLHTAAVTQTDEQQRAQFEKRADELAASWVP